MTGHIAKMLTSLAPRRFSLIVGIDPKVPPALRTELEHAIILGDCACGTTGEVKEIRNSMLLNQKGLIVPGCPPYRPSLAMIEEYVIGLGLVTREMIEMRKDQAVQRFYEYYQGIDPTWSPEE
jgi:hypothetical protein